MKLEIIRVGQSMRGTFGVLRQGNVPFALTLERPWLNNERFISCIPVGEYICKKVRSPKFGDTFEITNVPGRADVLFHWGNYVTDTEGCVLIGEEFSGTYLQPFIVASKRGFLEFMGVVEGFSTFDLGIHDGTNTQVRLSEV